MEIERRQRKFKVYTLNELNEGDFFILLENEEEILLKIEKNQTINYSLCFNFSTNTHETLTNDYNCYLIENVKLTYEF